MLRFPGAQWDVDLRVEVALLSSNVIITSLDGAETHAPGTGELFGATVAVHGNASARLSQVALTYCGKYGSGPSVLFANLAQVDARLPLDALPGGGDPAQAAANSSNASLPVLLPNPSALLDCALVWNMDGGVAVLGASDSLNPTTLQGNVFFESIDSHTVLVDTPGNLVRGNLALGTVKNMAGRAATDRDVPASFKISHSSNQVDGNVAAGSERIGFSLAAQPCGANSSALFRNNWAHSCLVGFDLRASRSSAQAGCSALTNVTAFLNWDFGVISLGGIATDVQLTDVNVADNKNAGILINVKKAITAAAEVSEARREGGGRFPSAAGR